MNKTIVAIYDDIVVARQVVEDLVKAGFARSDISLITNDAHNQYSHYLDKDYVPKDDAVTASEGAGFGAVVGGLTGVLVGLAALTIPGIGLAIAAGPIVAGLTGVLAGAVTGGIVGALVKSGVPEDDAPYYAEGIRRGGTLISLETSDTLRAEDIMNRQGAINIHERISQWRLDGWKGFDGELVEIDGAAQSHPVRVIAPITGTPIIPTIDSIRVMPVVPMYKQEPPIDNEDTAKSNPVIVTVPATDKTVNIAPIPTVITTEPALLVIEKVSPSEGEDQTT